MPPRLCYTYTALASLECYFQTRDTRLRGSVVSPLGSDDLTLIVRSMALEPGMKGEAKRSHP